MVKGGKPGEGRLLVLPVLRDVLLAMGVVSDGLGEHRAFAAPAPAAAAASAEASSDAGKQAVGAAAAAAEAAEAEEEEEAEAKRRGTRQNKGEMAGKDLCCRAEGRDKPGRGICLQCLAARARIGAIAVGWDKNM